MTVPNENYRNDYTGNGATSVFPYTFKVVDKTHLKVLKSDLSSIETTLTVDLDYTVSGVSDDAGGNITLTAGALTIGYKLAIVRNPPMTQLTDWVNQGKFNAEDNEKAFDLVVMLVQWVRSIVARCMTIPETLAATVSAMLPSPVALSLLRWNAAGTAIENLEVGSVDLAIPATDSVTTTKIINDAVTNPKLADMATQTFKGRATAGTGDPEDLTVTQATAMLNAVTGDAGSGGTKGLVPAPAAGDAAAEKFLRADGAWAAPEPTGRLSEVRIYTANDTWTKPAGLSFVIVEVLGAGGGGGGADQDGSNSGTGGGGGAGGYSRKKIPAAALGATETVTIGALGAGGAAGNNAGATGGASSFGAHATANGGVGGSSTAPASSATVIGGAGGAAADGDTNIQGQSGGGGMRSSTTIALPGEGGSTPYGNGARGKNNAAVNASTGYGAGGAGAASTTGGSDRAGGDGTAGLVIVYEYL